MGEYIENLKVPAPKGVDKRMHYVIFYDLAIEHIQRVWLNVTRFACGRKDLVAIPGDEWDLDTGRNKSAKDQRLVFWNYA